MDNFDKGVAVAVILLFGLVVWLVTSLLQEEKFIENNCIKTELVSYDGQSIYDCTGINID